MFTGIIECLGVVEEVLPKPTGNIDFKVKAPFFDELILGQSIAHNGVCLTVAALDKEQKVYFVTAIPETLKRTNLGILEKGDLVNLERCMKADGRFDGHIVQGHVDTKAVCTKVLKSEGELAYFFSHTVAPNYLTVEKGSVCVNGISLTVVESEKNSFSVAIIPFTLDNTNLKNVAEGSEVNVEFDIIGKYLWKMNQNPM